MDIKKENLNVYDDKQVHYLKNPSGNVLQVNKMIVMERFGFIWKPDTVRVEGDGKTGRWVKKLPAEEDFSISTEKEWTELENARLRGEGRPAIGEAPVEPATTPKLGPDDTRTQRDAENKARLKAEADAKAAAEAKAKADAEEKAKK